MSMAPVSTRAKPGPPPWPAGGRREWAGWVISLVLVAAYAARIPQNFAATPHSALVTGLVAAFEVLCLALPLVGRHPWLAHSYFILQSALVIRLLSVPPAYDATNTLFVPLALQAALVFPWRTLAVWIALLVLLIAGSAVPLFGWVQGLAFTLVPAVGCVLVAAYVVADHEIETARLESQRLLEELQAAQRRLQAYSAQAEELAAVEERNRLARELHDSVSQTLFSLSLNARAARLYLERDPARLRPQLEQLQSMAQEALTEIRGLIEHLRPAEGADQSSTAHT